LCGRETAEQNVAFFIFAQKYPSFTSGMKRGGHASHISTYRITIERRENIMI